MKATRLFACASVALFGGWAVARSDVVWPAIYLESRLLSPFVIILGLAIELAVVLRAFELPRRRAMVATVVMNLASALLGIALIPMGGLIYEEALGDQINHFLGVGTFSAAGWAATFLLAVSVNSGVEAGVLRYGFRLGFSWMRAGCLVAANTASVGVALLSLMVMPAHS